MTAADASAPTPYSTMSDVRVARAPLAISGLLSFVGSAVILVIHTAIRILGANSFGDEEVTTTVATVLGVIGLLSIVPIVLNTALGHVGMAATKAGRKSGRALAVAGLTLGYVLLVLYGNRLIVVLVAMASQQTGWDQFVPNFYWWA